jgi:hypothetical protein
MGIFRPNPHFVVLIFVCFLMVDLIWLCAPAAPITLFLYKIPPNALNSKAILTVLAPSFRWHEVIFDLQNFDQPESSIQNQQTIHVL